MGNREFEEKKGRIQGCGDYKQEIIAYRIQGCGDCRQEIIAYRIEEKYQRLRRLHIHSSHLDKKGESWAEEE